MCFGKVNSLKLELGLAKQMRTDEIMKKKKSNKQSWVSLMLKVKPRFHLNVNIAVVCPGHAHC